MGNTGLSSLVRKLRTSALPGEPPTLTDTWRDRDIVTGGLPTLVLGRINDHHILLSVSQP